MAPEDLTMPALTLVFTVDEHRGVGRETLRDLADEAIDAIEAADSRFRGVKAFTFYAGGTGGSDRERLSAARDEIRALRARREAAEE